LVALKTFVGMGDKLCAVIVEAIRDDPGGARLARRTDKQLRRKRCFLLGARSPTRCSPPEEFRRPVFLRQALTDPATCCRRADHRVAVAPDRRHDEGRRAG
jgi:hypothetical protein